MNPTDRVAELEARVTGHENMLRSVAAICEAVATGVPLTDLRSVMSKTVDKIRDHLNPRRGMAESRRGR